MHDAVTALLQVFAARMLPSFGVCICALTLSLVTFLVRVHALYRNRVVLAALVVVAVGTGVVAIWAITMRRNETESNDVLLGTLISQLPGCNFLFTSNE